MRDFDSKLDRAVGSVGVISESMADGEIVVPFVSTREAGGRVALHRARIAKMVHKWGDRFVGRDFDDRATKLPGKFWGFVAVTEDEGWPTAVPYALAELGEDLKQLAISGPDQGMFEMGDPEATDPNIMKNISSAEISLSDNEKIVRAVGMGEILGHDEGLYDDDHPAYEDA